MAHFRFNLRRHAVATRSPSMLSQRLLAEWTRTEAVDPEDEALGPGWYESSDDLVRGLEVQEATASDSWLNDWLAACRVPPSGRAAERDEQPGAGLVPAAPHGALGDAQQLGDLGLAVAAEVAHLDQFREFGIDGLELV